MELMMMVSAILQCLLSSSAILVLSVTENTFLSSLVRAGGHRQPLRLQEASQGQTSNLGNFSQTL